MQRPLLLSMEFLEAFASCTVMPSVVWVLTGRLSFIWLLMLGYLCSIYVYVGGVLCPLCCPLLPSTKILSTPHFGSGFNGIV